MTVTVASRTPKSSLARGLGVAPSVSRAGVPPSSRRRLRSWSLLRFCYAKVPRSARFRQLAHRRHHDETTQALDESGDRSVGGDRQTRQHIGGQHTEVTAAQTLDPHAFSIRHATSSQVDRSLMLPVNVIGGTRSCERAHSALRHEAALYLNGGAPIH